MNKELKKLFKRYNYTKNYFPQDILDLQAAIFDFTESLSHDLIRALHLKKLVDYPIRGSRPTKRIQDLLKKLANVQDPRLKAFLNQNLTFALGEDSLQLMRGDHQSYLIAQDKAIQELLDIPKEHIHQHLIDHFSIDLLKQKFDQLEQDTIYIDKRYHDYFHEFLALISQLKQLSPVSGTVDEPSSEEDTQDTSNSQTLDRFLYRLHRLVRRAEVGLEVIELVQVGQLSFMWYTEIMNEEKSKYDETLKRGLIISQLDVIHDYQLLNTDLFVKLRKQDLPVIEKELSDRMRMVQLLSRLYKQKWIDSKYVEIILKNSFGQQATHILKTLETFKIKKEMGNFIRKKVKNTTEESQVMQQFSILMKSVKDLMAVQKEALGDAKKWKDRDKDLSVKNLLSILKKHAKPSTHPSAPGRQKVKALEQFVDKMGYPKKEMPQPVPTQTPTGAQPGGPTPSSPAEIISKIEELKKQLQQAEKTREDIASSQKEGQEVLDLLNGDSVIFPETHKLFRKKLLIVQQRLQKGKLPQEQAKVLLGKWNKEIEENIRLETKVFKLLETLKGYTDDLHLTSEELSEIRDVDVSPSDRDILVDKCFYKYEMIHNLHEKYQNDPRLRALALEKQSAISIYLFGDILSSSPFFFNEKDLPEIFDFVPHFVKEDIETCHQMIRELFESSINHELLLNLIHWGVCSLQPERQKSIKSKVVKALVESQKTSTMWKNFQPELSPQNVQRILDYVSPQIDENLNLKGQESKTHLQEFLQQSEEEKSLDVIERELKEFIYSIAVAEYASKIHRFVTCFEEIEQLVQPTESNEEHLEALASHIKTFFAALEMRLYDQQLELLIEHAITLFSEDSPVVDEGKALYRELMGFEY